MKNKVICNCIYTVDTKLSKMNENIIPPIHLCRKIPTNYNELQAVQIHLRVSTKINNLIFHVFIIDCSR